MSEQILRPVGISLSSEKAIKLFGSKWTLLILKIIYSKNGRLRYNELLKSVKGINAKILTQRLKKLEEFGLIKKEVFLEVPVHAEYYFTEQGEDLGDIFNSIDIWSSKWIRK